jgi:hypothetical protein
MSASNERFQRDLTMLPAHNKCRYTRYERPLNAEKEPEYSLFGTTMRR